MVMSGETWMWAFGIPVDHQDDIAFLIGWWIPTNKLNLDPMTDPWGWYINVGTYFTPYFMVNIPCSECMDY